MFEVKELCGQLCLGKQGENLARIVYFEEPTLWKENFGEGRCELLHQRNGDKAPYPVVLELEGDRACWKVTNADTAVVGEGKCELNYLVNNVVVKSKTWTTDVRPSLGDNVAEPPEAQQGWVEQVLVAADEVKSATTHQPMIGDNKNWFVWDANTKEYVDSGILAEGTGDEIDPSQLIQNVETEKDISSTGVYRINDSLYVADVDKTTYPVQLGMDVSNGELIILDNSDMTYPSEFCIHTGVKDDEGQTVESFGTSYFMIGEYDEKTGYYILSGENSFWVHRFDFLSIAKRLLNPSLNYVSLEQWENKNSFEYRDYRFSEDKYIFEVVNEKDINKLVSEKSVNSQFSNVLKGSASGTVVAADDISPIEHPLSVKLTSDAITDFSGVQVKAYGKNLFSKDICDGYTGVMGGKTYNKGIIGEVNINGINYLNIKENGAHSYFAIPGDNSTAYTLTTKICRNNADETLASQSSNLKAKSNDVERHLTAIPVNEKRTVVVYGGEQVYFTGRNRDDLCVDLTVTQLELGTTATEFEPYKEPVIYTANADGTVDVTYTYPSMTLLSENSDAIINFDYNRDINKAFNKLTQVMISLGGML